MILLMGWKAFLLIQLPVIYFATTAGAWLFYIQHQFDQVIWARSADWDYQQMALEGSSYVKFPRILQWFSGNIGFHHIHHLSPKIPNYNLEKCQKENDLFQQIKPMKFLESLKTMRFRLWDEESRKLITFRHYRETY
jgi:omega-6 fatty acid desaturase (delta-12 desaturase)